MGLLTVANIASRVRRQFGDSAGILLTDAAFIDWINDAMREIVLDNDLLKIRSTSTTLANQSNYGLPADILRFLSVSFDGQAIEEISLQEARRQVPNLDNAATFAVGTPQSYWQYGNEMFLYPAPSSAKTLTLYYNRNPTLVTVVGDTPELPARYDNRLVEYCLAQAAEMDDDDAKAQYKMEQFNAGLERSRDEDKSSEVYPYMGVPGPDSYGYALYEDV